MNFTKYDTQSASYILAHLSPLTFLDEEEQEAYYLALVENVSFLYSLNVKNLGAVIRNQKTYVFFMELIHG